MKAVKLLEPARFKRSTSPAIQEIAERAVTEKKEAPLQGYDKKWNRWDRRT